MQSSSFTILIKYRNFGTGVGVGSDWDCADEAGVEEEEGTEEEEEGTEEEEEGTEKGGGSGQKLLPQ